MNPTQNQEIFSPPNTTKNFTSVLLMSNGFPLNIQIGMTIVAVSVSILALIGNILVVYIVCTVNHMRSSTNTLIANMAIADLLMAIDIPYVLKWAFVYDTWFGTFMGTVLCKFFHSAQAVSLAASVFSSVTISLDRSFAILFPMKKIMTRNAVCLSIAMVWLCALALSLPLVVSSKNVQLEGTEIMICNEFWGPISKSTYSLAYFITSYVIPLVIILVVYFLAGFRLWSRKLPGNRNLAAEKRAQASSKRATAMLITVVIVFALFWLPFQAYEMMNKYNPPLVEKIPLEFLLFMPWFGYANSAINPILYVIFSENYRQEFCRILCRGPSRMDRYKREIIGGVGADIGNARTTLGQSCESSLTIDTSQTRRFLGSCLTVDIRMTCESRGSPLAVDIPRVYQSRRSSMTVDSPSIPKSCGSSLAVDTRSISKSGESSVDIPLTRESCQSPLPVDKPLTRDSLGSSLAVDVPLTCDSLGSPLAVDILLASESCVSPLAVDNPITDKSLESLLNANIPLTPQFRESSLAAHEVEDTRL